MALITKRFDLIRNLEIRDTASHYPTDLMNLDKAVAWGFEVKNKHNQAVTVALIGGEARGLVGSSASVAANTDEPVATDVWNPWLGLRATYSTAPTSGDLTILGWVQEEE